MKTLLLFPLFFLSPFAVFARGECSSECSLATVNTTASAPRAEADAPAKKNSPPPAAPRAAAPKPTRTARPNYLFM